MSLALKKVLELIENKDGMALDQVHRAIGDVMIDIARGARKSCREGAPLPSKNELEASNLYTSFLGVAPGSPAIPFHLWEDLFLEGLAVLREFIETNQTNFWDMPSFKVFCKKGEERVKEWEKDPDLARLILFQGGSERG